MKHQLRCAGRDRLQRYRCGEIVFLWRREQLAIGKYQPQLHEAEHAVRERIDIDLASTQTPGIRMQRTRDLGQSPLVVSVLTLEMLRPKKQPLAPQELRRLDQNLPLLKSYARPRWPATGELTSSTLRCSSPKLGWPSGRFELSRRSLGSAARAPCALANGVDWGPSAALDAGQAQRVGLCAKRFTLGHAERARMGSQRDATLRSGLGFEDESPALRVG